MHQVDFAERSKKGKEEVEGMKSFFHLSQCTRWSQTKSYFWAKLERFTMLI